MKKLRKLFTVILAIELLILGFSNSTVKSIGLVRAIGPIVVNFPSVPLFNQTNWTPGSSANRSFTIQNSSLFSQTVAIRASNIIDTSNPPLSEAINIIISVNGVPVYGDGSSTGHKHLSDFYNEAQVNLTALGANVIVPVNIALQLHPDAGGQFQNLSTRFDIVILSEQVSNTLPTLKPLPTLKGLPTLTPLKPFNVL